MRRFVFALALCAVPGCFLNLNEEHDDPPPVVNPCTAPAEPPQTLKDGPYGSGVEAFTDVEVYPSFKSDYPKSLTYERSGASVRIAYVHEGKAVVETWTAGPPAFPTENVSGCARSGHETSNLTITGVTIDGAPGELARYDGASVDLVAGAAVRYRLSDGRVITSEYRHGFAPIFTTPCPFNRPVDGTACNETAICAYDKLADHCTTRCAGGTWQSYACTM